MHSNWFLEGAVAGGRGLLIAIDTLPFRVGRESTCELPVAAKDMSRLHARLERDGTDGLKVTDLGSTNGTFVNRTVLFDRNAVLPQYFAMQERELMDILKLNMVTVAHNQEVGRHGRSVCL